MKYLVVMRVVDRSPNENYIHTTMKSLIKSGLFKSKIPFEFHLFDGRPNSSDYLDQYKSLEKLFIHKTEKEITRNENWLRSVEYAKHTDCKYVIQIEDDIIFCKHWLGSIDAYITKHQKAIDDIPMVAFYAPYPIIEKNTKKKIEHYPGTYQQFYGTQCILFRKDIALKVVEYIRDAIKNFDTYPFHYRKMPHAGGMIGACIDLWLQEWGIHEYPKKNFLFSCPAFVQHIGRTEGKHLHQSHFLGEDWSYIK